MSPVALVLPAPLLAALLLAGCEVPTGSPVVDQRWVVPGERTVISVEQLLPAGVTSSGDAFQVDVESFEASERLGDLCPPCATLDGTVAPKPAFSRSFDVDRGLPEGVVEADIASGTIGLTLHNGFSFDPLRPGMGNTGSLTVTVISAGDGQELGRLVVDGADRAFPPGSTLQETLEVSPGPVGAELSMVVQVDSPEGDPVEIDASERVTSTATPTSVLVSSATVDPAGEPIDFQEVSLNVEDIDPEVTSRIQEGAIVLEISNPFGVPAETQFDIAFPGGRIGRPLDIDAATTSTARLEYSGDDLRAFLGRSNVTVSGSGTIPSTADPATVTPGQDITIDATLDLLLRVGG